MPTVAQILSLAQELHVPRGMAGKKKKTSHTSEATFRLLFGKTTLLGRPNNNGDPHLVDTGGFANWQSK